MLIVKCIFTFLVGRGEVCIEGFAQDLIQRFPVNVPVIIVVALLGIFVHALCSRLVAIVLVMLVKLP
jgi:hypothetical protein